MRHGAGPLSIVEDSDADVRNNLSTEFGDLSISNRKGGKRLGCYFCNDVVAPIDVSKLIISLVNNFLISSFATVNCSCLLLVNCKPYLRSAVHSYSSWTCSHCIVPCS